MDVKRTFRRVQINFINMQHELSGQYKWIFHAKDFFSKYSWLYLLQAKKSEPIARVLKQWLMAFKPLKIIQCNNRKKFQGALLLVLKKYGIKLVNSNPQLPQMQRLVEQANGIVKRKITAWKIENESTQWHESLLEISLAINMQTYLTTNQSPYSIVFWQPFHTAA